MEHEYVGGVRDWGSYRRIDWLIEIGRRRRNRGKVSSADRRVWFELYRMFGDPQGKCECTSSANSIGVTCARGERRANKREDGCVTAKCESEARIRMGETVKWKLEDNRR